MATMIAQLLCNKMSTAYFILRRFQVRFVPSAFALAYNGRAYISVWQRRDHINHNENEKETD